MPAGGVAIEARWFDGRSSRARAVLVRLVAGPHGPGLAITPQDGTGALELVHRQVGWPQAWSAGRAPRKLAVDLREHGSLEIDDAAGWHAALAAAGHSAPLAQRMQTRWPTFIVVLLVAVAALGAFYRWGTPWAATQITRHVPTEWEVQLAQRALTDLDGSWMKPSKLPAARQAELRARFDALAAQRAPELRRYPGYAPQLSLLFRASAIGPNAFALPGGTIVMTDEMVAQAARLKLSDEAVLGVLAHEIGHVVHRHTTRMVVEQGVLNIGLGLALGDVSTLVSFGGSLLTGLAYQRNHESEADCFALALMRRAGLPTAPTADLLLAIDAGEAAQDKERKDAAAKPPSREESSAIWSLLSSHPDTPARARALKAGKADGCG